MVEKERRTAMVRVDRGAMATWAHRLRQPAALLASGAVFATALGARSRPGPRLPAPLRARRAKRRAPSRKDSAPLCRACSRAGGDRLPCCACWRPRDLEDGLAAACAAAPVFPDAPEKRNCAALLAFVSLLWCTEALPLYVTAMLVPLLAVVLRVMVDRGGDGGGVRLSAQDAAPAVFKAMFSQARPPLSTMKLSSGSVSGGCRCHGSEQLRVQISSVCRYLALTYLLAAAGAPAPACVMHCCARAATARAPAPGHHAAAGRVCDRGGAVQARARQARRHLDPGASRRAALGRAAHQHAGARLPPPRLAPRPQATFPPSRGWPGGPPPRPPVAAPPCPAAANSAANSAPACRHPCAHAGRRRRLPAPVQTRRRAHVWRRFSTWQRRAAWLRAPGGVISD